MYENTAPIERAVLIAIDLGDYDAEASLDELEELTKTAGAEIVGRATQKRDSYDKATVVGSGKLSEIAQFAQLNDASLIIFDMELTASQIRNIESVCKISVIDRTMLILDIFAKRANTSEGKLQVELAQQRYRLPRLSGMGVSLSRLGAGIGTRGPGESKLETDKRHIRSRISALEKQLDTLSQRRQLIRNRRKKDGVFTAAIVGYTNVGKSTLLNTLTKAGVLAEDKLFATLDLTARKLSFPSGKSVLLIDTVGLIRRLPHHLVEAFKSTLEEACSADLILNVCDASSVDVVEQIEVTEQILSELKVTDTPIITVLNKSDKELHSESVGYHRINSTGRTVLISAKTGEGLPLLLSTIESFAF